MPVETAPSRGYHGITDIVDVQHFGYMCFCGKLTSVGSHGWASNLAFFAYDTVKCGFVFLSQQTRTPFPQMADGLNFFRIALETPNRA